MALIKIIKNTVIYLSLIIGYIFIYVIDIEGYIFKKDEKEIESKSKVNFIYQQF